MIRCQGKLFFALRRKGVAEYLVNRVMSPYKGCKTAVSVDEELSSSFSVKVGVHQGSTLSPLLFIMVMNVLTENMRDDLSTGFQLKVTSATKLFFLIK